MSYVLMLQEFQEEIAQIKDDVTHVNELASTFNLPDIQLSSRNLERIEDLNTRWSLLQVNTNAHTHTYLHKCGSNKNEIHSRHDKYCKYQMIVCIQISSRV